MSSALALYAPVKTVVYPNASHTPTKSSTDERPTDDGDVVANDDVLLSFVLICDNAIDPTTKPDNPTRKLMIENITNRGEVLLDVVMAVIFAS